MSGFDPATVTTVGAVMAVYLAILLAIGLLASRRARGGDDFHLAGRSLGAWAAGISSTASSESGWVTLGAVGMTWRYGISGLWFAPGCLLGYLINVYVVAPRLRRRSAADGSITMTDVLTSRYGDPGHILRWTASTIVLVAMMFYVAAQMTAAGKALSASLGLGDDGDGYRIGVVLGAVVITAVTALGGFRAVAWTDLFQGLLVAAALIGLPVFAVAEIGGFGALTAALAAADPALLTASGGRTGPLLWGFVIGQLGIGLGYPGMPHVVTRYMAARGDREIRRLRTIALLWGVAVFYGAGVVGLAARVLLPGLEDGERALMALAVDLTHPVVAGLLLAAVIAAILSTVSSQLLVASSTVSHDLVGRALGRSAGDRRSLVLGRWTVAAVGLLGVVVALTGETVVFWFVLFAWSALGASFAPLLLAPATGFLNRHGALAGMLTGAGVTVVWKLGSLAAAAPPAFDPARFDRLWVVVILAGAGLLLLGRSSEAFGVGHSGAVLAATVATLAAWKAIRAWHLEGLYELVPAFTLAAAVSWLVSLALPVAEPDG